MSRAPEMTPAEAKHLLARAQKALRASEARSVAATRVILLQGGLIDVLTDIIEGRPGASAKVPALLRRWQSSVARRPGRRR